jgi:hypothetical protein
MENAILWEGTRMSFAITNGKELTRMATIRFVLIRFDSFSFALNPTGKKRLILQLQHLHRIDVNIPISTLC